LLGGDDIERALNPEFVWSTLYVEIHRNGLDAGSGRQRTYWSTYLSSEMIWSRHQPAIAPISPDAGELPLELCLVTCQINNLRAWLAASPVTEIALRLMLIWQLPAKGGSYGEAS
jgi:hypothetical protein